MNTCACSDLKSIQSGLMTFNFSNYFRWYFFDPTCSFPKSFCCIHSRAYKFISCVFPLSLSSQLVSLYLILASPLLLCLCVFVCDEVDFYSFSLLMSLTSWYTVIFKHLSFCEWGLTFSWLVKSKWWRVNCLARHWKIDLFLVWCFPGDPPGTSMGLAPEKRVEQNCRPFLRLWLWLWRSLQTPKDRAPLHSG